VTWSVSYEQHYSHNEPDAEADAPIFGQGATSVADTVIGRARAEGMESWKRSGVTPGASLLGTVS